MATPVGVTTAPVSLSFFFIVSLLLFSLLLRIFCTEHIEGNWHSPSHQWVTCTLSAASGSFTSPQRRRPAGQPAVTASDSISPCCPVAARRLA